jgi:hypothetical protein
MAGGPQEIFAKKFLPPAPGTDLALKIKRREEVYNIYIRKKRSHEFAPSLWKSPRKCRKQMVSAPAGLWKSLWKSCGNLFWWVVCDNYWRYPNVQ